MKTISASFKPVIWMIFSMYVALGSNLIASPTIGSKFENDSYYSTQPSILKYWEAPCTTDRTKPKIYYKQVEFTCMEFPLLAWSYFIEVSDDCTPTHRIKVNYIDSTDQNCPYSEVVIHRTWIVTDLAGNVTKEKQTLYTQKVNLNQVVFPSHINTYCPAAQNISEAAAGVPTFEGQPVQHYCGLTVSFKDFNTKLCGNSIFIRRHWTVTDCCSLYALNYDQEIYYHDTTRPVIVCPAPLSYGTNVKECYTHQIVPGIVAKDSCNPSGLDVYVLVDGVEILKPGQRAILGIGSHIYEYHVTDVCGNSSICKVQVTVVDAQPPLLNCHPLEVCLITDSIRVGVRQFVDEFWDDCSGLNKVTLKIRKLEDKCGNPFDDLVFKDSVTICCAGDQGGIVVVEIEAKDQAGNVSTCLTEVNLTSKLPISIICQDSVKLSCGTPIPNIQPQVNFCGEFMVVTKVVFDNRNAGGVGTLIRRYVVTASNGLKDSCQTVFTIGLGANAFGVDDVTCPAGNVDVIGCNFPNINLIPGISLKDTARPCAQVMVTLKLDTFTNLGTPCLRIRRTWTIKDALQPLINVVCVQNINIIDTVKPKLSGVRDTTVIASLSCNALIDLPPMTAMDCDPNVVITNTLNSQGANIGPVTFPKGMTFIKYRAVDKCGNRDSLTIKVNVTDTARIRVICQNDTIIACGAAFTPRAGTIIASCTQIASNVLRSDTIRNRCSITKINFKRIITDTSGRKDSCTFMVTFRAADTLFCNQIAWPKDTTLVNCAKSVHPDSLNLKPIFTYIQGACSRVITTFKDTTIATSTVAGCSNTTRRIWTVRDTCAIPPVMCVDTQLIMVVDITKPVLKVPKDTCVFLRFPTLCDTLLSFLGNATAMDCDVNVNIKNVVIGKTDTAGASLVRRYPVGITQVLVIAKDACGNTALDTLIVTVKDTVRPIATCKKSNNYMNDQGIVRIHARVFDGGSQDNCTPAPQLKFSWTQNVNDTILEVNCNNVKVLRAGGDLRLDTVLVLPFERNFNLWVTDANGNQDTCEGNRFLAFFDTLNICGKNAIRNTAAIRGKATMVNGKAIPKVIFSAIGDAQYQAESNTEGAYDIQSILPGMYKMFPYKNDDPGLGVSTIDLLAIQKHILGIRRFTNMDQFIAADINKDGEITSVDLIELRKLLLGVYTTFPQNTSWRFFDQSLLARTTDPQTASEFETPFVEALDKDVSTINFTGIKIGDVNLSGIPSVSSLESRSKSFLSIIIPDMEMKAGKIVELPLFVNATGLIGIQGSILFDHISILDMVSESSMIRQGQYNEGILSEGKFNFSWVKSATNEYQGDQMLVKLYIRPDQSGSLAKMVRLNTKSFSNEAYNKDQVIAGLNIKFTTSGLPLIPVDKMILTQNSPNPFADRTLIRYTLPSNGEVQVTVTDITGRVVSRWSKYQAKGDHQWYVDQSELGAVGIYYYKMDFNGYSESRKLILIE